MNSTPLTSAPKDTILRVTSISSGEHVKRKLSAMGIQIDSRIIKTNDRRFGPIMLEDAFAGSGKIAIGRHIAEFVQVEIIGEVSDNHLSKPIEPQKIAIIGQPNSGKTTLFQSLADLKSGSGTPTYDLEETLINIEGYTYKLIDLPGLYSLNAVEPTERITFDFITRNKVDMVINVIDSTLITRGLELTTELLELGIPVIILLNKSDLSEKHGIRIDRQKLQDLLNVPVINATVIHGKGIKELTREIAFVAKNPERKAHCPKYTYHIEEFIEKIEKSLQPKDFSLYGLPRFYAIKTIENPKLLIPKMMDPVEHLIREADIDLFEHHKRESYETIALERHHIAMDMSEKVSFFERKTKRPIGDRLDNFLLHPIGGYVFLIMFLVVYFVGIFVFGNFLGGLLEAPLAYPETVIKGLNISEFWRFTLSGAYLGISGILGIVLPYFLPLVFLTSYFEETGYLSRIAFLVDGLFHKIGLHGKSVVPFILGFGCSIPAIYATRMIENRRDRVVSALLIPFVPCSARVAVIFALAAAFAGPIWALVIYIWVLLVIAVSGKILSKVYTQPQGLIIEIQELSMPRMKLTLAKTWFKTKDFLKEVFTFLIIGSVILSWIEYFDLAHYINDLLEPFISGVLDLPSAISSTLVFGFFRKELIIVMLTQALGATSFTQIGLSLQQIVVFLVFVTFYIPCFTTFVVLLKEFGKKIAFSSVVVSLLVAGISAVIFKFTFTLFQQMQ